MISLERSQFNPAARVRVALIVCVVCFFVLVLRLWYLQILRGDYFRVRSEENRLRTVYLPASRGLVMDRNGEAIVRNRPSFNVELIPEDSPAPDETVIQLAKILGYEPELFLDRSRNQRRRRRFEPRLLLRDVSRDVVAQVLSRKYELPGVIVSVVPARDYIHGDFGAHVVGYIREITRAQLDSPRYAGYLQGDTVGQFGVEAKWERFLQGKRGEELVIVNATGSRIGEYSYQPDIAGHNVTLTLDYDMQRASDEALRGSKGAIVAMDPNTGEILAMTSSPGFDPNIFAGELDPEVWDDLRNGPDHKLNNRVTQGTYPPGSVFKVFMAVAALAEGIIAPHDRVYCPGYLPFGGRDYRCHKKSGHGSVDLADALIQSCDVYFYTVGNRLNVDRIHEYATRFGLGKPAELELGDEARGLIPSTEWKRTAFRNPGDQKWYPGETLSVAIGQGAVTTTPLQIARGLSALVNGGLLMRPLLVKRIESDDGSFKDEDFKPEVTGTVGVDPKYLDIVRDALIGVVNDPRGTARRARVDDPDVVVAGKTGTAQVVSLDVGSRGQHHEDHAWFAGYAPADKPEVVVVALVENGGHGGVVAAPMVKAVMEAYFHKTRGTTPPTDDVRASLGEIPAMGFED